ncbi:hypothetical protein KCP77_21535 [Salmonella enterica subsp. enterica]|nr:hypothetical protein KCP77_21535 [Salmonella enterica subsp. enterica]
MGQPDVAAQQVSWKTHHRCCRHTDKVSISCPSAATSRKLAVAAQTLNTARAGQVQQLVPAAVSPAPRDKVSYDAVGIAMLISRHPESVGRNAQPGRMVAAYRELHVGVDPLYERAKSGVGTACR